MKDEGKFKKIPPTINILLFIMICFMPLVSNAAGKTVPLPALLNPDLIEVQGDDMFIAQDSVISIFSLKDFSLKNKFGKRGEGPQEFKPLSMDTAGRRGFCPVLRGRKHQSPLYLCLIRQRGYQAERTLPPQGDSLQRE